jgi:enoyl-CoA hydratase
MDLKAFADGELLFMEERGFAGFVSAPPSKPLITAVESYALAAAFEIALACDLIVAARNAICGIPTPRRGSLAAASGLLRLPRQLPGGTAMELALTGGMFPARRTHGMGTVNRLAETL